MNCRQTRTILSIAAMALALSCGHQASKHFSSVVDEREAWAESLSNPDAGIFFSASGPASRTLNISLMSDRRDPGGCDSVMATLLVRQDFLVDAYNRGFRSIACDATDSNGNVTTLEDRIVPPAPEPQGPPASPVPHAVPQRHNPSAVIEAQA